MEMMKKKEAHMKKEMERWGRWKPEDCKKVSEASGTFLYFAGESMKEGEKHEKMGHQKKSRQALFRCNGFSRVSSELC
ncbi:MAG: hypothetical protein Ct9H90mP6_00960 [Gammaproteobacteria bacterium]|nr:MAG: hypothetical protein Ct9H90mP6_00960 [Gammaproteobacteria bacterium]